LRLQGIQENQGEDEEEPAEVRGEDDVEKPVGGKVETAGEDAGVEEKDCCDGEGPAGGALVEIAQGPEYGDEEEDGGVEALIERQQVDYKETGEEKQLAVEGGGLWSGTLSPQYQQRERDTGGEDDGGGGAVGEVEEGELEVDAVGAGKVLGVEAGYSGGEEEVDVGA
jgi:hypothetical protein